MASNTLQTSEGNGRMRRDEIPDNDIKILVVGDEKCGKSRFIEGFFNRNKEEEPFAIDYARVYPCQYEIFHQLRGVNIYELLAGPDHRVGQFLEKHCDSNAFVFMYAIDDPSGFQKITDKWMNAMDEKTCWNGEPAILVGNKKDLRGNQQVIQRLAQNNQVFVTYEEGESLMSQTAYLGMRNFYESSALDESDRSIHQGFHCLIDAINL